MSAITLVKVQATSSFWPIVTPGIPGIEMPRQVRPFSSSETWYQMPGMPLGRCGSPATRGPPVAERSALTAQLFEQLALPVGRESQREQLDPGEHVGGSIRLPPDSQELELGGKRRGGSGGGVEAVAIRLELAAQIGVELGFLSHGDPVEAE